MAYSFVDYPSISVGTARSIPFPYLSKSHIKVYVEGALVSSTLYDFPTSTTLRALTGFPSGAVRLKRSTPLDYFVSVQSATSALDWEGMNSNFNVTKLILQEYIDSKEETETRSATAQALMDASVLLASTSASQAALSQSAAAVSASGANSSADRAELAAANAIATSSSFVRSSVSALMADSVFSYTAGAGKFRVYAGDRIRAGEHLYTVAADTASDHHVVTSGGVKLYVIYTMDGWNVRAFGAAAGNSASVNTAAIQKAVSLRGTVSIPTDPAGDYQINDSILVRSNTTMRWTGNSFLKLVGNTSIGGIVLGYYDGSPSTYSTNILIDNPLIDGSNVGAETGKAAGEVGVGGAYVTNMRVVGGIVKNCRNGTVSWSGSGGRGVQFDGNAKDCSVLGTIITDCHCAIAVGGTVTSPSSNVSFRDIVAINCDSLIQGRHTNSPPTGGVQTNSVVIDGVQGYNCGKTTGYWAGQGVQAGAIVLDRVNNYNIQNVTVYNDSTYGSISALVRHLRGNWNNISVAFYGDCTNLIDSNTVPTGFGGTGTRTNNAYDVTHKLGTANRALQCLSGDSANHSANSYRFKTATITTDLFDTSAALPGLFGFFENALGDKTIGGPLSMIETLHSRNYPSTFSRATAGSHQFNNLYMTSGTGTQILGTLGTDALVVQHNLVEKLRVLATGLRAVIPTYADNAAASSGGLVAGDLYKTATGEVRIRV